MHTIELIVFDIGGVLGTNGWDHEQRSAAAERFGFDLNEVEARHGDAMPPWEEGRISMDEYLDIAVFWKPRPFSREELRDFIFAQSQPYPESIALARALRATGRYRMATLNNESRELNQHRIRYFGLLGLFDAFLTSCYLMVRKPVHSCYERALGIAHVAPDRVVFIDDREQNLAPARSLGMHTIHFTSASETAMQLAALGVTLPAV
jgi:putative hydrolase of the HAD superfamily